MSAALKSFSDATADLVASTAKRVVAVHGRDWGNSSGFVLRPGVVATAAEALDRDEDIEVTLPDGNQIKATLAGRDSSTDVAVLRIDGGATAEEMPPASPRAGGLVLAVGRTAGGILAALGIVSLVGEPWRSQEGGEIDAMIRADIRLPRQAEGGPLVDADGRLVGMAVFGPRRRVLAIPTATLVRATEHLLAHGTVSRGYIGISVQSVAPEGESGNAERAAMVIGLDPNGPAKAAGLLVGDIVGSWNGEPVSGARAIVQRLGPGSVGRTVELGLVRGGNALNVNVVVAERPAA